MNMRTYCMYLIGLLRELNGLIQRLVNTILGKQQILRKQILFQPMEVQSMERLCGAECCRKGVTENGSWRMDWTVTRKYEYVIDKRNSLMKSRWKSKAHTENFSQLWIIKYIWEFKSERFCKIIYITRTCFLIKKIIYPLRNSWHKHIFINTNINTEIFRFITSREWEWRRMGINCSVDLCDMYVYIKITDKN